MMVERGRSSRNVSQRRESIVHLLAQEGALKVVDLVGSYGVSSVTIRNDLTALESQGLARRSHGGAVLVRLLPVEHSFCQKDRFNYAQKQRIGARAAALVAPGDSIMIDSGTTTFALAQHLRVASTLTVMTNGLNSALQLADVPGVNLILAGGLLRKQSMSLQGDQAEACLHSCTFDKLFLAVDGFDLQFGVTTHNEAEASVNRKMVDRADQIIVLTDASKFGCVSLHRIAQLERVHTVITDASISPAYRDGLEKLGIELIIAD